MSNTSSKIPTSNHMLLTMITLVISQSSDIGGSKRGKTRKDDLHYAAADSDADADAPKNLRRRRRPRESSFMSLLLRLAGLVTISSFIFLLDCTYGKLVIGANAFAFTPIPVSFPLTRTHRRTSVAIAAARKESDGVSSSGGSATTATATANFQYRIRDCQYKELKQVAALVVASFYDKKKTNLMTRKLYQIAEMNRLQQNYAYPESRTVHRMLIVEATPIVAVKDDDDENNIGRTAAAATNTEIVGFCDVDARPCATKLKLPRPYLSDLAVDPNHRRQGLARRLVEESEKFILEMNNDNNAKQFDELWIRVAENNEAAIGLYKYQLGYTKANWSTSTTTTNTETQTDVVKAKNDDEPEIWTLRKNLRSDNDNGNDDDKKNCADGNETS